MAYFDGSSGHTDYTDLDSGTVNYVNSSQNQAQASGATVSNVVVGEPNTKNFMSNFDLSLIGVPWRKNPLTKVGDPQWTEAFGSKVIY